MFPKECSCAARCSYASKGALVFLKERPCLLRSTRIILRNIHVSQGEPMFAKGHPRGLREYPQDPNERPCFLRTAHGLLRGPLEHPGAPQIIHGARPWTTECQKGCKILDKLASDGAWAPRFTFWEPQFGPQSREKDAKMKKYWSLNSRQNFVWSWLEPWAPQIMLRERDLGPPSAKKDAKS